MTVAPRKPRIRSLRECLGPKACPNRSTHRVGGRGRERRECREVGKRGWPPGSSASLGPRRIPPACQEAASGRRTSALEPVPGGVCRSPSQDNWSSTHGDEMDRHGGCTAEEKERDSGLPGGRE
ncbi:PREDICTED: uncharacterized protein LOC105502045 [Colobus angolensis palliatus]|uniref:uncharacterized protein LOC105502045 n=1 Tax=Colobus angolensis palliatus TaxID=336983 RepID=UPI0005F390E3|nr:PREDICTED: uncharacterized protein LOC105502045 [Colobus angolensis palliatus]